MQQMFNDRLQIYGYVLLNDVYQELGIQRTKEGSIVGWAMTNKSGDGYVDFGLDEKINMTDDERFILDFNVDGVIYDYIG